MNTLQIKPNIPYTLSLVDPEGHYDPDAETVTYQTTQGQTLTLPHRAAVALNLLEPQPGEELVITRIWSGKRSEPSEWTVALSPISEKCRARAEETPSELSEQLERSIEQVQRRKRTTTDPTPIRRPSRKQPAPEVQPRLFDRAGKWPSDHQPTCSAVLLADEKSCNCGHDGTRYATLGTGTHGPAPARSIPLPAVAIGRSRVQGQIPANVATREILAFIQSDPNTANWSDQSRQDLLSTILIAAYRAGHVGLWERQS